LPPARAQSRLPGLQAPSLEVLTNGCRTVSLHLPDAPLVCIDFWCRAGSVYESDTESGIAHFLEHMVFKGSRQLGPGEFDRRIEALGGSSNAATGFDDVHYHVLIEPQAAAEAVSLLLELVLEPRLDSHDFEMERQVVLEELAQSEDQPEEVALQHLLSDGCGSHPYGRPILGRRDRLLEHTPAGMAAFQRRLYSADRCVLALSGALDPALDTTRAIADAVAASPLGRLASAALHPPLPPLQLQPGERRISLPRLESARLLMLWALPAAGDLHGVMGADLLTSLLAEGRRSRLVHRLREELRLVESIDLDLHVMECGSLALLEAIGPTEHLPAIRREIAAVLNELADTGPQPEEWLRSGRLVANGYRFGLESAAGVAGVLAGNYLWEHERDLEAPLAELEHWDAGSLLRDCVPLMSPERATVLEAIPA
jgi:zinc protease